jgi:hypothetical protein
MACKEMLMSLTSVENYQVAHFDVVLICFVPSGAGNQAITLDERCSLMPLKMSLYIYSL